MSAQSKPSPSLTPPPRSHRGRCREVLLGHSALLIPSIAWHLFKQSVRMEGRERIDTQPLLLSYPGGFTAFPAVTLPLPHKSQPRRPVSETYSVQGLKLAVLLRCCSWRSWEVSTWHPQVTCCPCVLFYLLRLRLGEA